MLCWRVQQGWLHSCVFNGCLLSPRERYNKFTEMSPPGPSTAPICFLNIFRFELQRLNFYSVFSPSNTRPKCYIYCMNLQSHKKIFFYSESSGALESAARLCKTGSTGRHSREPLRTWRTSHCTEQRRKVTKSSTGNEKQWQKAMTNSSDRHWTEQWTVMN